MALNGSGAPGRPFRRGIVDPGAQRATQGQDGGSGGQLDHAGRVDHVSGLVREVLSRWPRLSPVRGRSGADVNRYSPGFRSTSPANDDAIALVDSRSEDVSVYQIVHSWAQYVRSERGLIPKQHYSTTVEEECAILLGNVEWICEDGFYSQISRELSTLVRNMRRAMADVEMHPLLMSTAEIAGYYGIAEGTVRSWATRDNWQPFGGRKTRRWDMDEVACSYSKRHSG